MSDFGLATKLDADRGDSMRRIDREFETAIASGLGLPVSGGTDLTRATWSAYEPGTFNLDDGRHFSPKFLVVLQSGEAASVTPVARPTEFTGAERALARGFPFRVMKARQYGGGFVFDEWEGGAARQWRTLAFSGDRMNKTERRFSQEILAADVTIDDSGGWTWAAFEPEKIRLGHNQSYTPDFYALGKNGKLYAFEVKARWTAGRRASKSQRARWGSGKAGFKEDAREKVKIAATLRPWIEFRVAFPGPKGLGWEIETIKPGGARIWTRV